MQEIIKQIQIKVVQITGIYDLNGGAWERVAAYITNGDVNLSAYGSSLVGTNTTANANGYLTLSTREITVYPYNRSSDTSVNNWTIYNGLKTSTYGYGDAVLETSTAGRGSTSWNGDYSYFAVKDAPFFNRGGIYNSGSFAGVFAFYYTERHCAFAPQFSSCVSTLIHKED